MAFSPLSVVPRSAIPSPVSNQIAPRPFLKWAGGKSRLIQQYLDFFPQNFETYFEPFLGGGAIFFYLSCLFPVRGVLMDINPELVNVYTCVKDQIETLMDLLEQHRQNHSQHYYYLMRATVAESSIERAARLIYLNKTCFNGLYRENSKGQFNVPMGRYKNPRIFDPEVLCAASKALQLTQIYENPFETVLNFAASKRDFVYFDPPYYPISATSNFTAYNRYSFHAEDQIKLRNTFAELASRGVQVMLSNSDCPFIRELYQDFKIHPIIAARAINSDPSKRGKISEVLITSY
ncbi:DNA methyltransferase [Leptolyngbya sp. 'hensonii']|uniref:DNA adenine methylase n=1 Tax=Leptolyngbya sp. 'hensonii' TaxID=1922337 RepID=UPI0009501470|nr:DNA adenine methylase [Leptolyngbya sp. 'hensonii']OLP18108.1 DNA methyltransferase [Leptolyngbya sp. 'hensonii']